MSLFKAILRVIEDNGRQLLSLQAIQVEQQKELDEVKEGIKNSSPSLYSSPTNQLGSMNGAEPTHSTLYKTTEFNPIRKFYST